MSDHTLPDPGRGVALDRAAPTLIVIEDESTSRHPLPASGVVTIGRGAECELVLRDRAASRRHACLRVDDGRVLIADLGSYNGTAVNGDVLTDERELRTGDVVQICTAMLVFDRGLRRAEPPAIVDDAALHQRLSLELDRASRYQRAVTIVAARFAGAGARDTALPALRAALRSIDVLATDGATGALAVLPELTADEREPALAALAGAVAGRDARLGWAAFPGHGVTAATLLASARAAAAAAAIGQLVATDGLARRLELGGTTVVVAEPAMLRAFALLERFALSELPVLVLGETGVGKDSAAVAIHQGSRRRGPLRTVNCAAIAEGVVESELFGHERGAFSGAVATRIGLFEAAAGGTVFLDEVGELSLAVQAKLLRALDGKAITRVGAVDARPIDVRVVAATHRDLRAEAAAGRFREDLYYRLAGATVTLPPLRERPRELPLLARELLARACDRLGREPAEITPAAMHALAGHRWPGNIRELRNVMDYAAAAIDGDTVDVWHLPADVAGELGDRGPPTARAATPSPPPTAADGFRPIADELRGLERKRMLQALRVADGVQTRAAELLRMPRRTFVAKMRDYGLHAELEQSG